MRRVLSVLLAIIYTTLSTGAPSLVHFCSHEEVFHLATGSHEHEELDCCHSEPAQHSSCHSGAKEAESIQENDDCCTTSYVKLDHAKQENTPFSFIELPTPQQKTVAIREHQACCKGPILSEIELRGPPLYILLKRFVLYA